MEINEIKYAIVLDRRTGRVIVIKLNPANFLDEEIEDCDWEQIMHPYEDEGKFDLTYCDWMFVSELKIETFGGSQDTMLLKDEINRLMME